MGSIGTDRHEHDAIVSFVLRALQLAFSAMALVLCVGGFRRQTLDLTTIDGQQISIASYLGGPTLNLVLLVTFSASLFTIVWIVCVYLRPILRLPLDVALAIDAILAILLISGGLAFLASDYVRYCDVLHKSVRCGVLKTGGAFVLVAFLWFLCSVAWGAYVRVHLKKHAALNHGMRHHPSDIDVVSLGHSGEEGGDAVDFIPSQTPSSQQA